MEGGQGWVLQGVLSRASFRRPPLSGQKTFTVLSLHTSNIYAKNGVLGKQLILTIRAVMLGEHVDLVAGDFGGAVWRCRCLRTWKKPLQAALWQRRLAPHPCGDPDRFQTTGLTFVGSLHRPIQIGIGKSDFTAPLPFLMKLLACAPPIKAATMKHGFTSTSSTGEKVSHNVESTKDPRKRTSCAVPLRPAEQAHQ